MITVLIELADGSVEKHQRSFSGFKRDRRTLVAWLLELRVNLVVTWKAPVSTGKAFMPPGRKGRHTRLPVVNARHARNVPGRKADIPDSEWLAQLRRLGLVKPSFIPPQNLQELRWVSRDRQKQAQILAGEKNRLDKVLDDAGIQLGAVVSDIDGFLLGRDNRRPDRGYAD